MTNRANVTVEVDPISRIEGHLGVKVTTDGSGIITDARAHGNLWRGFENFLLGRDINDAITYTQRICGVCPVPHGLTSTYASDAVLGFSAGHITFANTDGTDLIPGTAINRGVPPKAVLIRNLVQSAEFLMSSITHFYHLAAPSYVQGPAIPPWTPYFDNSYYHGALQNVGGAALPNVPGASASFWKDASGNNILDASGNPICRDVWDAVIISYVRALRARRLTFEAGALFAGRMPMTSCFVAGGVTNDHTEDLALKVTKFKELVREVGLFIINEYVPIALTLGVLYQPFDSSGNGGQGIGGGLGRYLAWGGFPNLDNTLTLPGGLKGSADDFTVVNKAQVYSTWLTGARSVPTNLTEDIANSRYSIASADTAAYTGTKAYPGNVTRTKPNRGNGYSYMKAPRWAGQACEVGPLARLAVAGIYPVDGTSLWLDASGNLKSNALGAAAGIYVTTDASGNLGLDARVLGGQIAQALINAGLATVAADGKTVHGAVASWILGLTGGKSTMDRLRARALESVVLVQAMVGTLSKDGAGALSWAADGWIDQLAALPANAASYVILPVPSSTVQNWGANEAPRGALMHQAKITGGKIVGYQCIVPTTWNGSPMDASGNHGAIEAAVIGAPFSAAGAVLTKQNGSTENVAGGVEVLRIAQSFDPCIACAVH